MAISRVKLVSLVTIGIILFLFLGVGSFFYFGSYSIGDKAGVVIIISQKGYVFKTGEGEMNINDQGNTIEKFEFSVEGDQEKVIEDLKEVALTGERIRISYIERYRTFSWRGDTKFFITEVIRQKGNEKNLRNDKEGSRNNDQNIEKEHRLSSDSTAHDM